jgi:hypothetical protein
MSHPEPPKSPSSDESREQERGRKEDRYAYKAMAITKFGITAPAISGSVLSNMVQSGSIEANLCMAWKIMYSGIISRQKRIFSNVSTGYDLGGPLTPRFCSRCPNHPMSKQLSSLDAD